MPPQSGTMQGVSFMPTAPKDVPDLEDLELLGWIHSQAGESTGLSPHDLLWTAKMAESNPDIDPDNLAVITVGFPAGVCSLSAFKLSKEGQDWGRENAAKDPLDESLTQTFSQKFYQRRQIWLSNNFNGFFLAPDNQTWNFNFMGVKLESLPAESLSFSVDLPKPYYHPVHRVSHFVNFCKLGRHSESTEDTDDPEKDDELTN